MNLLWAEAGNTGILTEEEFVAIGSKVRVSKKGYVELLSSFAAEVQSARREPGVTACRWAELIVNVGELELKGRLLADDTGKVGELQKLLSAKEAERISTMSALEASETTLKA